MPIRSDNSVSDIFRLTSIMSSRTSMAIAVSSS
jgi:hypothetical protein